MTYILQRHFILKTCKGKIIFSVLAYFLSEGMKSVRKIGYIKHNHLPIEQ